MPERGGEERRLDALLARLVDETITARELGELESILDGDPAAQRRYLHYLGLHADLDGAGGAPPVAVEGSGRRPWIIGLGVAAAAATAFAVALWIDRPAGGEGGMEPIARIVELDGSIAWTGDGGEVIDDLEVGDPLGGGTLEALAANSWADIEFLDGSRVAVSGHSVVTFSQGEGGKLIRLRRGDLSVDAAPQPEGSPLRLITPSAEAEVLGTQFNVSADSYSTRVSVNEGVVRVKRLSDGSVQRVEADQQVVAALERETEFKATPRPDHIEAWESQLPRDIRYGEFLAGEDQAPDVLQARPLMWRENPEKPVLLHVASVDPSGEHLPPVRLTAGGEVRVRGRLAMSHLVVFGLTALGPQGGFAGKFETYREIEVSPGAGGDFEVALPLDSFRRQKECFPESAAGLELFDCWILTVEEDAGLEIISVELTLGGA